MNSIDLSNLYCYESFPLLHFFFIITSIFTVLMCLLVIVLFMCLPKVRLVFGKHVFFITFTYLLIALGYLFSFFINNDCKVDIAAGMITYVIAYGIYYCLIGNAFIVSNLNISTYINLRSLRTPCSLIKLTWQNVFFFIWGFILPTVITILVWYIMVRFADADFFIEDFQGHLFFVLPIVLLLAVLNCYIIYRISTEIKTFGADDSEIISQLKQKLTIGLIPFVFELITELLFLIGPFSGTMWPLFYLLNPLQGLLFSIYIVFFCVWNVTSQEVGGRGFFGKLSVPQCPFKAELRPAIESTKIEKGNVAVEYERMK